MVQSQSAQPPVGWPPNDDALQRQHNLAAVFVAAVDFDVFDHHGRALLCDFGIALSIEDTGKSPSLGTLAYMSPEQVEEKPVDHRSDIFSLGVVLVELLTGQRPFDDDNPVRLREDILAGEPSLSLLPSGLDEICQRCLARNPDDRYANAESLAADLGSWTQHRPTKKLWAAAPVVLLLVVAGVVLSDHFFGTDESKPTPVADTNTQPSLEFAPLSATPSRPMSEDALAVHRQACQLFNEGKVAKALPLLDRVVQLDPTNHEAFKNRGIAHLNLGNFDLAVADLETALELDTEHPDEYRKILSQTYAASAVKHSESKAWQDAIADMDQAIEQMPTADYFDRRASMYFNVKQYEKAIEDWNEAIQLAPTTITYYRHRGYAFRALESDA